MRITTGTNTPEGVLVRIKDKLCLTIGLDVSRIKLLVDRYVIKTVSSDGSKSHFTKVNMFNDLTRDRMTIKVFFKFLRVILVKRVTLRVEVTTVDDYDYNVTDELSLSQLEEAANDKGKGTNTPEGVLVRIKDKLCSAMELDVDRIKLLVDRFVTQSLNVTGSKAHFTKTNTFNDLTRKRMTIKVFFKFLRIILVQKVTISITVTTVDDKEFTVSETMTISQALVN